MSLPRESHSSRLDVAETLIGNLGGRFEPRSSRVGASGGAGVGDAGARSSRRFWRKSPILGLH